LGGGHQGDSARAEKGGNSGRGGGKENGGKAWERTARPSGVDQGRGRGKKKNIGGREGGEVPPRLPRYHMYGSSETQNAKKKLSNKRERSRKQIRVIPGVSEGMKGPT